MKAFTDDRPGGCRLRRRRRRRPCGRCRDRHAPRPLGPAGRLARPVRRRERHALDPRPDACRRGAAAPVGLARQVIAAGTPAVRRTVFRYGAATTEVTLKPSAESTRSYAPRRTVLDPILVQAAREAGADVVFGASVTGVDRAPDGRVTGVVGHDQRGDPLRVRAAVTVGADGLHSTRGSVRSSAPVERRAAGSQRLHLRARLGPRDRRLRVVLRPRSDRRAHSHQREADLCMGRCTFRPVPLRARRRRVRGVPAAAR